MLLKPLEARQRLKNSQLNIRRANLLETRKLFNARKNFSSSCDQETTQLNVNLRPDQKKLLDTQFDTQFILSSASLNRPAESKIRPLAVHPVLSRTKRYKQIKMMTPSPDSVSTTNWQDAQEERGDSRESEATLCQRLTQMHDIMIRDCEINEQEITRTVTNEFDETELKENPEVFNENLYR